MSEYLNLNEAELRKYIKSHPEDEEAFQHYLSIIRAKPNRVIVSTPEQLEEELQKRISQKKA
ncbi:MAG: hypothetical protein IGS49_21335 [Chlorogloeopsis fritschii C42_A2020_084]|uniref:DUF6887 family protein n=1 Tax=Chlorogloeopsis fritschii TaxID=1124 RepID=UPI001A05D84B|nr:hypothetical protein [Chlorogloeopsis fritschii]MBF2007916.1 hypothetical protein [Chlorogloeopsis fritschii C42_A2020_084]